MQLFDSHAHYDDKRFDKDRDALLQSLPGHGVGYVTNIGCDVPTSRKSIALAERYGFIYATVGVHPHNADEMVPGDIETLEALMAHPKVRALGEIGLDYHYDFSPRMVQMERFAEQLDLAQRLRCPVVIHEREATRDCLDILRRFDIAKGVFHCYSGSLETAKVLIDWGWHLSFTGVITFANARKTRDIIAWMPADRLMIETDCPYLTPEPFRGKRNESTKLIHTLRAVADIRGIPEEEAARLTTDNALRFYDIVD